MADEILKIDKNYKGVVGGVTNDSDQYITIFRVNPTTKRLLVEQAALDGTLDSVTISGGTIDVLSGGTVNTTVVISSVQIADGTISSGSIQLMGMPSVIVSDGTITTTVSIPSTQIGDGTISSGTMNVASGSIQLMGMPSVIVSDGTVTTTVSIPSTQIGDGTISSGTMNIASGSIQLLGTSPVSFSTGSIQLIGAGGSIQLLGISPVSFSTGSVQIIGTTPVSGTFWQATQPVSFSTGSVQLIGTLPNTTISDGTISSGSIQLMGTSPVSFSSGSIQLMGLSPVIVSDGTIEVSSGSIQLLGISPVLISNGSVQLLTGANAIGKLGANSGVDIGDVTINNAAGAAAVNIQDGGNSITVDGAVSVSTGSIQLMGINPVIVSDGTISKVSSGSIQLMGISSVIVSNGTISSGTVKTVQTGVTSIGTGSIAVVTAGTPVQFPSVACSRIFIQAYSDNTGLITIGDSSVVAAVANRRGLAFYPTQGDWLNINNLNLLYIDSLNSGDKAHYFYEI